MTRTTRWVLAALLCVAGGAALPALGQKDDAPTIRDIMGKLNRGPNSLTPSLAKDLRDAEPDWELIQESTAEYVELTRGLGKHTPPKGDKASWQRLAKAYADDARALDAAAKKKDKRGTAAVLDRINKACAACHKVHRPE